MPKYRTKKESVIPYRRGFKKPTEKQLEKALGFTKEDTIPRIFLNGGAFHPVPECTCEDDWLAQYNEHGQTYNQFMADCPWLSSWQRKLRNLNFNPKGTNLPDKYPDATIYILPVGEFNTDTIPPIDDLIKFTSIFFGMPVKKLSAIDLKLEENKIYWTQEENKSLGLKACAQKVVTRTKKETGHIQLNVDSVLTKMKKIKPENAVCVIALSAYDLYGDETDLFVAGMAAGDYRVAIFSLFRYDPNMTFSPEFWYDINHTKKYSIEKRSGLILLRSCRLLVHEIAHLLGVDHCINYACIMNGSGHLEEDFNQPMFLCPVDLRKMYTLCGFNVAGRYRKMLQFFSDHSMEGEKTWVEQRLEYITKTKNKKYEK